MAEKRNIGATMMDHLLKLSKKKKAGGGFATTEELAEVAGVEVKDAYSRLWWLQTKEGKLVSTGTGKDRKWRLAAKTVKALSTPPPPEA